MAVFCPRWCTPLAAGAAICAATSARAQTAPPAEPPTEQAPPSRTFEHRARDLHGRERTRALSESVRRFGREHQDTQILSVEPILIRERNLNRIKAVDAHGRIRVWIDDPRAPNTPARRVDEEGDDGP